jgi:hypothetical protein
MQAATRAHDNYIKDGGGYGRMEMDTHEDTCVLGINFVILEYSGRICDVDVPPIKNFIPKKRHSDITAADLSNRWRIGIKQAQDTLDTTTQTFSRSALLPLSRRYRNDRMFYWKYLNHQFAADLYLTRTKSLHGNTCAYIFAHKSGFAQAYPQVNKIKSAASLRQFSMDWGIPRKLIVDGAIEQVGHNTECIKRCRTYDINLHV